MTLQWTCGSFWLCEGSTQEKVQSRVDFWIPCGSRWCCILSPALPSRVHGGPVHLANLNVIFCSQFSGQLTLLTVIVKVGSQMVLCSPLRAKQMQESLPYLSCFSGEVRQRRGSCYTISPRGLASGRTKWQLARWHLKWALCSTGQGGPETHEGWGTNAPNSMHMEDPLYLHCAQKANCLLWVTIAELNENDRWVGEAKTYLSGWWAESLLSFF